MNPYYQTNPSTIPRKLPFNDRTNFVPNKGVDLLRKTDGRYRAINEDSKFKLDAKVHVQRLPLNSLPYKHNHIPCIGFNDITNFVSNKGLLRKTDSCYRVINEDSKFKLNAKVHVERLSLNSLPYKHNHIPCIAFNDGTNLVSNKGVDLLRKTDSCHRAINKDSKFKLNAKVHVQRLPLNSLPYKHNHIPCIAFNDGINFVSNKSLLRKTDSRYRVINEDSKFKLNAEVHVQRLALNSLPYRQNHIPCIANDPKFKLNVKVHLQRLYFINNMPNSPSKGVTVKQSATETNSLKYKTKVNHKNVLLNKASKELKQVNKQKRVLNCSKTNTNLRARQRVVKITPSKELERFLKSNKKLNKSDVHNTKNKCNVADSKQHVPVYLQDNTNKRSATKNDPYEFTVSPSKQQRAQTQLATNKRGRPKKIKNVTDSNGITYDKDVYNFRKVVRQKVIKKAMCRIRKNAARNKAENVNNNLKPLNSKMKIQNVDNRLPNNVNRRKRFHPNNSTRILNTLEQEIQLVSQRTADTSAKNANFNPRLSISDMFFGFGDGDDTEMHKRKRGNSNKNVRILNVLEQEIQCVSQRIADTSTRNAVNAQLDDSDMFFGFVDEEDTNDISKVSFVAPSRGIINSIRPTRNANSNKFVSLTSTPLPNSQKYSQSPQQFQNLKNNSKKIHVISNILIPSLQPTNKRNIDKSPQVSNSELSVVSNSQKTPPRISFGFDSKLNSTSVCSPRTRRRIVSKPWRGDNLSLTRNPHWLTMKDTSLPCYNQEMVLEPKLLEMPNVSKTPCHTEESEKQTNVVVQSSIIDFINCNKRSPAKNVNNSSLFDYDDFSPIKDKNKTPNKPEHLRTPKSIKVKKNILNEIENNTLSAHKRSDEVLNVENYFGFDGPDSETEKENRIVRRKLRTKANKKEEARPMRVPLEQLKKVREEAVEVLLDQVNFKEAVVDEALVASPAKISANNEEEEQVAPVGLFEDLEQAVKPTYRSYEPKRRKRVRFPSVNSDKDIEEEEVKPKRKRKDVRNRAEEEEFVKWAAAFNAMCDEVEQHSLEIDSSF